MLEAKFDKEGNPILDENSNPMSEPVVDEKGNKKMVYDSYRMSDAQLRAIAENVAPLLRELVEAFEV